ncbi:MULTISPECIES: hypothetical protein [unclassified Flavobacterium]|jgi:hypothetical protein|uniref:hypothetical protein n=1 Tax=unclassified Flavobacterium TaxID=196869 RepID=UPI00117B7073|nr:MULTISPECIES: hypothetical protein [unclassified Flavobacterium]WKL43580.1 hypothetical protein Q1W72_14675 [Flavobacterium sp. ZE23DGlu08]
MCMKKIIVLLLLTSGMYAQEQVFNVQRYCIDEQPFKQGECNITGNEYSFVFLDTQKRDVVFFLTATKMKYKIVDSGILPQDRNYTFYTLENENEQVEMRVNQQHTKIEFLYPDNHIYLTVGKSTKAVN